MRRGTHGEICPRRGPEFKANDSEATALPRPERAREQEPGWKAGDVRRRVWHGPATPARYGESRIARILMTSGGSCTLVGSTFVLRRHCEPRVQVSLVVHLAQWAMPSEGIQGHAWGTYSQVHMTSYHFLVFAIDLDGYISSSCSSTYQYRSSSWRTCLKIFLQISGVT